MTIKERIFAEIERIDEDQLDALYAVIKQFTQTQQPTTKPSLMTKLKRIQIDAPEDFAANLDLYLSREQRAD
jgi:acyl-CoA-binding protein